MPLFNLSKFIAVPILSEWLDLESFLVYDIALCSKVHRPNFLQQVTVYNDVFQRIFLANLHVVLSVSLLNWTECRELSLNSFQECWFYPSLVKVGKAEVCRCLQAVRSLSIPSCFDQYSLIRYLPDRWSLSKISVSSACTDDFLVAIAKSCPCLKSCSIVLNTTTQRDCFAYLCMKCTELEDLIVTGEVDGFALNCILVHAQKLKYFSALIYLEPRSVMLFLVHFRGEIRWNKTPFMSHRKLMRLFLLLQGDRVHTIDKMALRVWSQVSHHCPNITELDVSIINEMRQDLSEVLRDMPKLRVFNHSGYQFALHREALLALTLCRDLREVTLVSFRPNAVDDWRVFFESLPHLTHFSVSNVRVDNDTAEILTIINRHPSIKYLSVRLHSSVRDDFTLLSSLLYKVTSLQLNDCNAISEVGVKCLANSTSSSLTEFSAYSCHFIRDQGITELMKCCGKRLRSLKLKMCSRVTDTCLESCALYGSALRVLDVSGSERISLEGVAVVAQHMTRLKELTTSFRVDELRPYAHVDLLVCLG